MLKMIADYMENGFLENIIDMFRHDNSLYPLIGELIEDKRSRVRIGAIALVETLMKEAGADLQTAIPAIANALKDSNPTIRGDAAHLLGIMGNKDALPFLSDASNDKHDLVRQTVREAIDEINSTDSPLR